SVAWSPDGHRILGIVRQDGVRASTVRIWDGMTGAQLHILLDPEPIWQATWSPNGSRILTVDEQATLRIWDAATGAQLRVWQETKEVGTTPTAAWNPDSQRLAIIDSHGMRLRDADRGRVLLEFREAPPYAV